MEIKENSRVVQAALKYMREKYLTPKPFPHLAELIYCLTKSYFDRVEPIPPQDNEVMLFALGFGLEKIMLPEGYKSESKIVDNIYYTPDLAIEEELTEIKTTRMKYNTGAVKLPESWLEQTKGYCYCEGIQEMNLAILHITGDYRPPFPKLAGYTLHYTKDELMDNWQYIKYRRLVIVKAIKEQKLPEPYKFCKIDWECQHCRYQLRCQSIVASSGELHEDNTKGGENNESGD